MKKVGVAGEDLDDAQVPHDDHRREIDEGDVRLVVILLAQRPGAAELIGDAWTSWNVPASTAASSALTNPCACSGVKVESRWAMTSLSTKFVVTYNRRDCWSRWCTALARRWCWSRLAASATHA
jgi:hypothetical protein